MGKNVLVEMRHGFGDLVHLEPMLYLLKKKGYSISIILRTPDHYELIKNLELVENYFFFDFSNKRKIIENIEAIFKIRKMKFDYGIISPITTLSLGKVFMKILKVKKIIYTKVEKSELLHRVVLNLKLLEQLDIKIDKSIFPKLKINKEIINNYKNILEEKKSKKINIILSTMKLSRKKKYIFKEEVDCKNWGLNNFIDLIKKLEKYDFQIILTGILNKENENKINEEFKFNRNIKNFINKTSLIEAAALSSLSNLVIGNDTGGIHIASALGKRTLTIFGPTDPKRIGAYSKKAKYITLNLNCQYCYGSQIMFECKNRKCFFISSEEVFKNLLENLN